MNRGRPTSFTSEFHEEFQAQTHALLRRRFQWFSGLLTAVATAMLVMSLTAGLAAPKLVPSFAKALAPGDRAYLAWLVMGAVTCAYLSCFIAAKRGRFGREGMLRLTYILVTVDGLLRVGGAWADVPGSAGLLGVTITHVLACLFLPWSPGQAMRPLIPVIVLAEVRWLFEGHSAPTTILLMAFTPLVGAPGTLLCLLRHSRRMEEFKLRFFQRRYGEVRRELVDARRIHEALFPTQLLDGPIRFSYVYEPMHLIGGDYLFAYRGGAGDCLSIVVMDVTGHGIPAALTVNRLHGELSRLFAEHPDISPGEVLSLLNRYVHLTLATHSVYVTALCLRFNMAADRLEYASGGHPPAYVKGVDGTVHELVSTAFVLGACAGGDFKADAAGVHFGPGDALVAYTDGALEARDDNGRMIGLAGMRRLMAGPRAKTPGEWPRRILSAVEQHRRGAPEDDTLVIEVVRVIDERPYAAVEVRQRETVRA